MPAGPSPTAVQAALVVLATLLGTLGCSMSVSAAAIPRLPAFRIARRQMWLLAGASLAAAAALLAWTFAP